MQKFRSSYFKAIYEKYVADMILAQKPGFRQGAAYPVGDLNYFYGSRRGNLEF